MNMTVTVPTKAYLGRLKPNALSIILLLVIVLLQGTFFSSASITYPMDGDDFPGRTQLDYGIGAPIQIATTGGTSTWSIGWATFAANLVISYILATLLSAFLTKITRFRRPAFAYGLVAIAMFVAAFLASIGISKVYWGYFFVRPPVLSAIDRIAKVTAVIPIEPKAYDADDCSLVVKTDLVMDECLAACKTDPYYCLDGRLLLALEQRGLLPDGYSTTFPDLPALYALIRGSGILARSHQGYGKPDCLRRGTIVDAVDKNGNRLVFVGVTGWQLSNDHYPYYEMFFTGQQDSPGLLYVRGQRFFCDSAGIEGLEWYCMLPFLSVMALCIGFPVFTVFAAILHAAGRTKTAHQSA